MLMSFATKQCIVCTSGLEVAFLCELSIRFSQICLYRHASLYVFLIWFHLLIHPLGIFIFILHLAPPSLPLVAVYLPVI